MAATAAVSTIRAAFCIHLIAEKVMRSCTAFGRTAVDLYVVNEISFQMYYLEDMLGSDWFTTLVIRSKISSTVPMPFILNNLFCLS